MLIAKDLMNVNVPSLSFDATVIEAVEYFEHVKSDFAVIYATKERLQGVLTEPELIKIFLRYQSNNSKDTMIFYRDCLLPVQLVHESTGLHEVIKKVMTSVGNRIFVIDDKSELIGYITARNVLPILAGKQDAKKVAGPAFDEMKSQLYLYESFFSKSPFMMHSVNPQGYIQMANEILHQTLGYEYGELIGKTIFDLYSKQSHEKAQKGIQTIISKGYHQVVLTEMVRKNGEIIPVELASRLLEDPWHNPIGTITVSRPTDMNSILSKL